MGYEPGYLNWWAFRGSSMGCNSPHRKVGSLEIMVESGERHRISFTSWKKNTNKQAKYLFEDTKNADGLYFNTNNNFGYVWLFSIFPQWVVWPQCRYDAVMPHGYFFVEIDWVAASAKTETIWKIGSLKGTTDVLDDSDVQYLGKSHGNRSALWGFSGPSNVWVVSTGCPIVLRPCWPRTMMEHLLSILLDIIYL